MPRANDPAGRQPDLTSLLLDLPADAQSAGVVRGAVASLLRRTVDQDARDTATLLVTELVTNAARHVGGDLHVEAGVHDSTLRVEVCDAGRSLPVLVGLPDWESESGRGLVLLEALSDRWGAEIIPTGKCVWFELAVAVPCSA